MPVQAGKNGDLCQDAERRNKKEGAPRKDVSEMEYTEIKKSRNPGQSDRANLSVKP